MAEQQTNPDGENIDEFTPNADELIILQRIREAQASGEPTLVEQVLNEVKTFLRKLG